MNLLETLPNAIENIIYEYKREFEECEHIMDISIDSWLVLDSQITLVLEFLETHEFAQPMQLILVKLANTMRERARAVLCDILGGDIPRHSEGVRGLLDGFNQSVLAEIYLSHISNECFIPQLLMEEHPQSNQEFQALC